MLCCARRAWGLVGEQVVSITCSYVPLDLILPDQPNRAVRTRMLRGVGGALSDGRPYPDRHFFRFEIVD